MKRIRLCLLVCLCLFLLCAAIPAPTADLYVNDYANVLTANDRDVILSTARQLEKDTGAQVAILTVDSLEGMDIAAYAYETAERWKLGQAGADNGVLIVLSTGDRLSRIEVGYGLEGTLTDILTGRIQDEYMLPYYREGQFSDGLREGYNAVASTVYQHYGLEKPDYLPNVQSTQQTEGNSFGGILLLLVFILIITGGGRGGFLLPMLLLGRGGGNHRGGGFGGGTFGGGGGFGGGGSSRKF